MENFLEKIGQIENITSQLELISQKKPEEITESDTTTAKFLAAQAKTLLDDIYGVSIEATAGSGLPSQGAITISLSSEPSSQSGEIQTVSEIVTANIDGNGGTLGTLTGKSGTTSFDAIFTHQMATTGPLL